jgi:hypothetical protein
MRPNSDSVTKPSFIATAFFLAATVDNLPPAIGSSRLAARLERLRLMAQLYVGYGSDIERDRKSYTEVVVFASYVPSLWTLAPNDWANGGQSAVVVGSRLSVADIASNSTSSSIAESISSLVVRLLDSGLLAHGAVDSELRSGDDAIAPESQSARITGV